MDPNKVYFLDSDIKEVEKYRFTIDEQLNLGDLTSAFQIYNLYQKRMMERFEYIEKVIKQPVDFSIDESYHPDREKSAWAKSTSELNLKNL